MKKPLLAFCGAVMLAFSVSAQSTAYLADSAANVAGVYTDLGTGGTVIAVANSDNANSAATPIGFTFTFGCDTFTDFVLNTNGFIKLGTTPPSAANLFYSTGDGSLGGVFNSTDTADVNIISVFNHDLDSGATAAEFRVETSGTVGSRVCTIQFKNLKDKTTVPAIQYSNIEFQIKLYEGTNVIEFVYGTWTASANASAFKTAAVGLKTTVPVVAATKASTTAWSSASFLAGNYTGNTHNHRNSVLPTSGRTYRFTPVPGYDVAVAAIYGLTNMPLNYGSPHVIEARLRNNNSCDSMTTTVTLSITGTNTFLSTATVTIPPSSSVTQAFPAFTPTVAGANIVTVSLGALDSVSGNNTMSTGLNVDLRKYSYTDTSGLFALNSGGALFSLVSRYITSSPATVDSIYAFLGSSAVGFTYGIWDKGTGGLPGTKLYTSAAQTSANGANQIYTGGVNVTDTFYVGVTQTTTVSIGIGVQAESPVRPGVFLYSTGTAWTDYASGNVNFKNVLDAVLRCAAAAPAITGNANAVQNTAETYSVTPAVGASYSWAITGGTPATASGTSVNVTWGSAGTGTVIVNVVDASGCKSADTLVVNIATIGIASHHQKLISVSPNPSEGIFYINNLKGAEVSIELFDVQGRSVVKNMQLQKASTALDIRHLDNGVYYLKITSDDTTVIEKLVKQQ